MLKRFVEIQFIVGNTIAGSFGYGFYLSKFPYRILVSAFCIWISLLSFIEYVRADFNHHSPFYPYFQFLNIGIVVGIFVWTEVLSMLHHNRLNYLILGLLLFDVMMVVVV